MQAPRATPHRAGPYRHISGRALCGWLLVAAMACRDREPPTAPSVRAADPTLRAALSSAEATGRPLTPDERYAMLAERLPGFAGVFYDTTDGARVISLVDPSRAQDAISEVDRLLGGHDATRGVRPASKVHRARHDFLTLFRWKHLAAMRILPLPGVLSVDIDETRNRLLVEVHAPDAIGRVRAALEADGIESDVAMVEEDTALTDEGLFPSNETNNLFLTDPFTSAPGGIQIQVSGGGGCTLGFNAYLSSSALGIYSSTRRFVTAAHCTRVVGGIEFSEFYQPNTSALGRKIGTEVREPRWDRGYNQCPAGYRCSLADAALIDYDVAFGWEHGRLARTTFIGAGDGLGSVEIDWRNPRYRIHDSTDFMVVGQVVHKLGYASGLTTGRTDRTCTDIILFLNGAPTNFILGCQYTANMTMRPGDSGGPIFILNTFLERATLAGLAWAGGRERTRYSDYAYVSYELTDQDRAYACGSVFPCWTHLTVSSP